MVGFVTSVESVMSLLDDDEFLFDDNQDELLATILEEVETVECSGGTSRRDGESAAGTALSGGSSSTNGSRLGGRAAEDRFPGFDREAGTNWLYPTNYPVRSYQLSITKKALFSNTLVCLPTGLGKTFIAAVVMFNLYRWYPSGKVVFMAPTKPLVAQQIEACFNVMGIPQEHMVEMTGSMAPRARQMAWNKKRIFFLTPQVFVNDLTNEICPVMDVKCLVVDEAHKATANYSYVVAVKTVMERNLRFRVLALSATPGYKLDSIQEVITNLLISNVEIRVDDSIDLLPYLNKRSVDKIVVPLGEQLEEFMNLYMSVLQVYVKRLEHHGVLSFCNPERLTKFMLMKEREKFRESPRTRNMQHHMISMIESDFALCMTLYHGYDLLRSQSLRCSYNFLRGIGESGKGQFRTQSTLAGNPTFCQMMDRLEKRFGEAAGSNGGCSFSHPKLEKLVEIILDHFGSFREKEGEPSTSNGTTMGTRVMIFAEHRDMVEEITQLLNRYQPLVKALSFVGQSRVGAGIKGLTQKLQLEVLTTFRQGNYNTLVSTCVGEEGLDIGEVDLIVCYEAHRSPVRLIQRMGRTGRKRDGRVVMLVTQGAEENVYQQSLVNKTNLNREVSSRLKNYQMYPLSPRMVPHDLKPECLQINVPQFAFSRKVFTEKQRVPNQNSAFLSDFELAQWLNKYKFPEARLPPTAFPMMSLCRISDGHGQFNECRPTGLSLSEWVPWQSTSQRTFLVSHTATTQMLVSGMHSVYEKSRNNVVVTREASVNKCHSKISDDFNSKKDLHRPGAGIGCASIRNFFSAATKRCQDDTDAGPSTSTSSAVQSPTKRAMIVGGSGARKAGGGKKAASKKSTNAGGVAPSSSVQSLRSSQMSTVDRFFKKKEKGDFFSFPEGLGLRRGSKYFPSPAADRGELVSLPNFKPPPRLTNDHLQSFHAWASKSSEERSVQFESVSHVNFKLTASDEDDSIDFEGPIDNLRLPQLTSLSLSTAANLQQPSVDRDANAFSRTLKNREGRPEPPHLVNYMLLSEDDDSYDYKGATGSSPPMTRLPTADVVTEPPSRLFPLETLSCGTTISTTFASANRKDSSCDALLTCQSESGNLSRVSSEPFFDANPISLSDSFQITPNKAWLPSKKRGQGEGSGLVANVSQTANRVPPFSLLEARGAGGNATNMRQPNDSGMDETLLSMTGIFKIMGETNLLHSTHIRDPSNSAEQPDGRIGFAAEQRSQSVTPDGLQATQTSDLLYEDHEDVMSIFGPSDGHHRESSAKRTSARLQSPTARRADERLQPLVNMKLISSSDSDDEIIMPSPVSDVRRAAIAMSQIMRVATAPHSQTKPNHKIPNCTSDIFSLEKVKVNGSVSGFSSNGLAGVCSAIVVGTSPHPGSGPAAKFGSCPNVSGMATSTPEVARPSTSKMVVDSPCLTPVRNSFAAGPSSKYFQRQLTPVRLPFTARPSTKVHSDDGDDDFQTVKRRLDRRKLYSEPNTTNELSSPSPTRPERTRELTPVRLPFTERSSTQVDSEDSDDDFQTVKRRLDRRKLYSDPNTTNELASPTPERHRVKHKVR